MLVAIFIFVDLAVAFLIFNGESRHEPNIANVSPERQADALKNDAYKPEMKKNKLVVSGWLPYWRKNEGVASLDGNFQIFNEINPFDFGVTPDGNIIDTVGINNAPWSKLRENALRNNVKIIPTILWGDAAAMHKNFADETLRNHHVDEIVKMLDANKFNGVDIDYEGKDVADRENFSLFIKSLHAKLKSSGKTLSCTVEARTSDVPPTGFTGIRAMSWANDLNVLNTNCDDVRVMAYDQVFQVERSNNFTTPNPAVSNADDKWVSEVVKYFLQYIAPEKLVLGVPTYGWEFKVKKVDQGYQYSRLKSISYPDAIKEAQDAGVVPVRNSGGEMTLDYNSKDGEHFVVYEDAESVKEKILIAQNNKLKGISLFKIDGLSDPNMFKIMEQNLPK